MSGSARSILLLAGCLAGWNGCAGRRTRPRTDVPEGREESVLARDLKAVRRDFIHRAVNYMARRGSGPSERLACPDDQAPLEEWLACGREHLAWLLQLDEERFRKLEKGYPDYVRIYSPIGAPEASVRAPGWLLMRDLRSERQEHIQRASSYLDLSGARSTEGPVPAAPDGWRRLAREHDSWLQSLGRERSRQLGLGYLEHVRTHDPVVPPGRLAENGASLLVRDLESARGDLIRRATNYLDLSGGPSAGGDVPITLDDWKRLAAEHLSWLRGLDKERLRQLGRGYLDWSLPVPLVPSSQWGHPPWGHPPISDNER